MNPIYWGTRGTVRRNLINGRRIGKNQEEFVSIWVVVTVAMCIGTVYQNYPSRLKNVFFEGILNILLLRRPNPGRVNFSFSAMASISLYKEKNQKPMNLLLIILCFVMAYGLFALIAFKIVKVLFPNTDSHDKPWKVKTP